MPSDWLPGVHIAPNIQDDPQLYELENRALDPEGRIMTAMWDIAPWEDRLVVDLGAGTGFYLPTFCEKARHVFAVEPHGPSRLLACERVARLGLANASVLVGSAEQTHLADASIDLVQARFAYFWGPGCEPGLRELARIVRPGGSAIVIDNGLRGGTFARWLEIAYPRDADAVESFWDAEGFARREVESEWRFERREDLERVVRLEFRDHADALLAEHQGLSIDYVYALYHRRYG